jgi:predicted esterase
MIKVLFSFIFLITTMLADEIDFNHDGWEREAYLYKPSCIPDDPDEDFELLPLVFMIHGLGGVGADNYDFSSLAEDSCFMVVFPSGMFNTWNAGPGMPYAHDIDDNSYYDALIDTIYNNYPLDTNRVYLTGHSMGGFMASHLNCTSTSFTAYGGSGGGIYYGYNPGNEHENLCRIETGTYPNPMIISHGTSDNVVPYEWAIFNLYHFQLLNRCSGIAPWSYDYPWPEFQETGGYWEDNEDDLEDIINSVLSTADTLEYTGNIERYQWSNGCLGGQSALEAILLPLEQHAWHQTWNSAINTPLEHWNFLRQFSKDEMGPILDSLALPVSEVLDNDYYISGETTTLGILAIDNYSVASMTITLLGLVSTYDLTIDFNTNERLVYPEIDIILNPTISTDSYETVQIVIADHHGNEKVYDLEALQELGLYQQIAIVNYITTSTDDDMLAPKHFTLHQNYPNPFNPETSISYDLPEDGFVSIAIYDMRGGLVKTLVNDVQTSGYRTIKWDGTNDHGQKVSAGLYLYRIEAEGFTDTKKMAFLK